MASSMGFFARLCLLVLLSPVSAAPRQISDVTPASSLLQRQSDNGDLPSCMQSCDINTCGASSCNIGATSLSRRSFDYSALFPNEFSDVNITDTESGDFSQLSKRIWRFDPASNTPTGNTAPTTAQVDAYVPAVFRRGENAYFQAPQFLDVGDESAVSRQRAFGAQPFQIMTGGIHGCMTIALISNQGVWMAHYWETYSHGRPNGDNPNEQFFIDRIIKHILGETVTSPAPFRNQDPKKADKPYLIPTGPAPDQTMFGTGTSPRLFISTPIKGENLTPGAALKYQNKVNAIKAAFRTRLNRRAPNSLVVPYKPLNYDIPAEFALANNQHRGMHLFQYDPNSDNNGQRAWRLFMENNYWVENL